MWGWRPRLENLMIRLRTQCRVRNAALLGGDNTMTQEIYFGILQISWGGWGVVSQLDLSVANVDVRC